MILQIFRPPNDGESVQECKLGDINDAISLEYEQFFCGYGTFTLELPATSPFADTITENKLIYLKDVDICFIAKNIKRTDENKITIKGYDLNGMLLDRITMARDTGIAGAEGKDLFTGDTEACVKHFVDYNMISSTEAARNYPRLVNAVGRQRGLKDDSTLVAYECVEDVVRTLCEGAQLGYKISFMPSAAASEEVFVFDVAERVDKTANQTERNRVVFSVGMKNITSIERETGIAAEKNTIWCDTELLPGFVYREDDENGEPKIPVSWNRREEYLSFSVPDESEFDTVELYARKEMADKFAAVDSLIIDAGNPLDYGTLYSLGDIVTVYDKARSVQLDSWISAVSVKRTATEHSVKITLGDSKPKKLDGYAKQTDILKKNQREFPAVDSGSSSGAALTEYEYISDSSVKYNGVTYSVEKNDNGLISRISDDNGNDFKPTISGGISDVTLHNALFWAVAMHSGISRNYYDDTLTPMVQYRYNVGRYTASGADIELLNQADGAALPLVFEGATLNSDNVYIIGNPNSRGYIDYTAPAGELNECTTYLVAKGATTNAIRFVQAPSTYNSHGAGEGFISEFGQWCAGAQANATNLRSGVSITSVSVLALRHVGDTLHFYVNGKYIGVCPTLAIPVTAGKFWMGITAGMYYDGGGYHYYDFAFAESAHSEADVIQNSKYLMYKYGVK